MHLTHAVTFTEFYSFIQYDITNKYSSRKESRYPVKTILTSTVSAHIFTTNTTRLMLIERTNKSPFSHNTRELQGEHVVIFKVMIFSYKKQIS